MCLLREVIGAIYSVSFHGASETAAIVLVIDTLCP